MDRDLCANCGHWREEHYGVTGEFIGGRVFGCAEYQGIEPTEERRAKKADQLRAAREAIRRTLEEEADAFYATAP